MNCVAIVVMLKTRHVKPGAPFDLNDQYRGKPNARLTAHLKKRT